MMLEVNNKLYQEDLKQSVFHINIPNNFKHEISILVTGASGLIGSFLIDTLVYYNRTHNKKIKIYGLGRNIKKLKERFDYCITTDRLNLFSHDICEPLNFSEKFDYIIHAASNADPNSYSLYPVETIKTNVLGITNVLEYAKKYNTTRVLLTSTMEVYGDILNSKKFKEEEYGLVDFNNIRSGYPESKRVSELLCRSYYSQYGVDCVIARLGYIYGPSMNMEDSKVIAQFIKKALSHEDIVLKSKGQQYRSYCYIADTIAGLLCILFKGVSGEAYNIANKDSIITIKAISELVAKQANTRLTFDFPEEIEARGFSKTQDAVLDETKLLKLGWVPEYNMETGLRRTITILERREEEGL